LSNNVQNIHGAVAATRDNIRRGASRQTGGESIKHAFDIRRIDNAKIRHVVAVQQTGSAARRPGPWFERLPAAQVRGMLIRGSAIKVRDPIGGRHRMSLMRGGHPRSLTWSRHRRNRNGDGQPTLP
jgi:hypothetical protein